MKMLFCLYKYFPYGGLQRDFFRIAQECLQRGHQVEVLTMAWSGPQLEGVNIHVIDVKGASNHTRLQNFYQHFLTHRQQHDYDLVVGFNKMPGLDVYYAADPCYAEKNNKVLRALYRLTPRYRLLRQFEQAVFSADKQTRLLLISNQEKPHFIKHYLTPDKRFTLLPPGIARDRAAPADRDRVRQVFRQSLALADDEFMMLMVGSGFVTKGLDRAIMALSSLPDALKAKTKFFIVGQDKPKTFLKLARKLGVERQVIFMGGRDDVPQFMIGADVLIHPAYHENTGTVLLEAMIAGLPVLATAICGYSHYVQDADAGKVIDEPFKQPSLNMALLEMLSEQEQRVAWQQNGIAFGQTADIYSMPHQATDVIESVGEQQSRR